MSSHSSERLTVDFQERTQLVVFLIGMRVHAWWKPWRWLPVAWAMGSMLRELSSTPGSGLLGVMGRGPGVLVQYWESTEALLAYAADRQGQHYPAWAAFNRELARSGVVGIWHETFVVDTADIECVYHHMPAVGLGSFLPRVQATGARRTAAQRLAASELQHKPA